MKRALPLIFALLVTSGCESLRPAGHYTGPWNLRALQVPPAIEWGVKTGLVQEVYYRGEPYQGQPTRVFAYLARPATGSGQFPAMVLVHGGGGKAFREWAEHWAKRGYVALAMDTAGCGPDGRLPDGGPDQTDPTKFRNFSDAEVKEMWTFHAVSAVIRGVSLLRTLPEVDVHRIGITGISWGGYLTCIVAGLDHRLKVAVPVYGCGFLGQNSAWKTGSLAQMAPDSRERWLRDFDPSQYLGDVDCPILFLNGSNDFAYPLDSYQSCYRLVRPKLRSVCIVLNLPHGHIWTFEEVDAFVDGVLRHGTPLPHMGPAQVKNDSVSVKFQSPTPITAAALNYTLDGGPWQKRRWTTVPARTAKDCIQATLPGERPVVFFLSVTDERGLRMSCEHQELAP